MHHVSRIDWGFVDDPAPAGATASGLARRLVVGPDQGAIHTDLAAGAFAPGGWIQRHVHSFEEALYVLSGSLLIELDGHVHRLEHGDYALIPIGIWHALGNDADEPVRWIAVNSPQRLGPDAGRKDTFYAAPPFDLGALAGRASVAVRRSDAAARRSLEHAAPGRGAPGDGSARGRKPAGMDIAVLAYSGSR
jgi:quercetin dioxygenase-like cupin family protein